MDGETISRLELEAQARRAARHCYMGNNECLCFVLSRYKMLVPRESWVTVAMLRAISPGMRVLVLGANMGYFAILFAHLVGPAGHVVAVEPQPRLARLIRLNAGISGLSKRLETVECAVGAENGRANLLIPDGELGGAAVEGIMKWTSDTKLDVEQRTLDRVWDTKKLGNPDVLFMDIEGSERRVWSQLDALKPALVVAEFNPVLWTDPEVFARQMSEYGGMFVLTGEGGVEEVTADALVAKARLETVVVLRK